LTYYKNRHDSTEPCFFLKNVEPYLIIKQTNEQIVSLC